MTPILPATLVKGATKSRYAKAARAPKAGANKAAAPVPTKAARAPKQATKKAAAPVPKKAAQKRGRSSSGAGGAPRPGARATPKRACVLKVDSYVCQWPEALDAPVDTPVVEATVRTHICSRRKRACALEVGGDVTVKSP